MGHKTSGRASSSSRSEQLFFAGEKIHYKFKDQHGGVLRQKRRGRKARPLSTKDAIHLVFKIDRSKIKRGFRSPLGFVICNSVIKKYSKRFFVKIDQLSINSDHIHLIVRLSRRSLGQHFFRVVAGQIAQQMKNNGFWETVLVTGTPKSGERTTRNGSVTDTQAGGRTQGKEAATDTLDRATIKAPVWKYRPFTRVIRGWKAYNTARNYVILNQKEAEGKIPYRKERLKGLSSAEWQILWN